MEHSIYLPLASVLMLLVLIALVVLINILKKIKEQLSTIGKYVEFTTHGTFTATINATITTKNNNKMEKKIEDPNNGGNEMPKFSAAPVDNSAPDSQSLDGTISGSFDSKSSGGNDPIVPIK